MNKRSRWAIAIFVAIAFLGLVFFSGRGCGNNPTSWKLPAGKIKPAVAIGDSHGVILASDGSLWTWGENASGWMVLGLGNSVTTQACLRRIGSDTDWVEVAVGGSSTLALKADGTMWGWGANYFGQLGDGTRLPQQSAPVRSVPGTNWKQVATSGIHSVALKRDGTLWSWGDNWAGQLGNGTTNRSLVPVQAGTSSNWTRIWANLIANVGQQADGSLWFWGWDYSSSKKSSSVPIQGCSIPIPTRVSPDTNWVDVGMGDWMVFAVKSDGTLWAWGREAHVFTGADATADPFPTRVGTDTDWRACAPFAHHCPLFMRRDGSLWVLDGSDSRGVANVTTIVKGLVTNNQLNCVADSDTLGGDPAMWVPKSLEVTFQIGGSNYVATFKEHSNVNLRGAAQDLQITRALYGDPKLFGMTNAPWLASTQLAQFRRIALEKDVVAFCGGRHGLGVALTSEDEVWMWGEALGQHKGGIPPLQFLSGILNRAGVGAHLGEPGPVILKQPARLGVAEQN
jgi:alpha-tubulin suppressor-like RCC1 family protein